jgi:hypothetical protein
MDNILITNYKPDYTNNIMTISVQINSLGISSQVSITMDEFNNAISGNAGGVDRVKVKVLNTLIDGLKALRPDSTTTTTELSKGTLSIDSVKTTDNSVTINAEA